LAFSFCRDCRKYCNDFIFIFTFYPKRLKKEGWG